MDLKQELKRAHHYTPFILVPALLITYRFLTIITFNPSFADPVQRAILIGLPFILLWSIMGIAQNRVLNKSFRPPRYPSLKIYLSTLLTIVSLFSLILSGLILLIIPGLIAFQRYHHAPPLAVLSGLSPIEALKESKKTLAGNWKESALHLMAILGIGGLALSCALFVLFIRTNFNLTFFLGVLVQPTAIHEFVFLLTLLAFMPLMVIVSARFVPIARKNQLC